MDRQIDGLHIHVRCIYVYTYLDMYIYIYIWKTLTHRQESNWLQGGAAAANAAITASTALPPLPGGFG